MTTYHPRLRLRVGDLVIFDGDQHEILSRVDGPNRADTFSVAHDGETKSRHMDWFAEEADRASVVVIER